VRVLARVGLAWAVLRRQSDLTVSLVEAEAAVMTRAGMAARSGGRCGCAAVACRPIGDRRGGVTGLRLYGLPELTGRGFVSAAGPDVDFGTQLPTVSVAVSGEVRSDAQS